MLNSTQSIEGYRIGGKHAMYLGASRGAFFPTVSGVVTVLYAMLTVCSVAWQGRLGYTNYTRLVRLTTLRSYTKY